MRSSLVVATISVALCIPSVARGQDELVQPDRPSEESPSRGPNRAMLITGAALFVGAYGASAIVGATSDNEADEKLFIPVVGPFLDLGERECGGSCSGSERFAQANLVGAGAAQAVGLVLVATSFFVPNRSQAKAASVQLVPMSLRGGAGIGAVGTF